MGPSRFDIIVRVAKTAMQQMPKGLEHLLGLGTTNEFALYSRPAFDKPIRGRPAARARGASTAAKHLNFTGASGTPARIASPGLSTTGVEMSDF